LPYPSRSLDEMPDHSESPYKAPTAPCSFGSIVPVLAFLTP